MLCSNSAFRTQDGFLAYISALKDGVLRAGLIKEDGLNEVSGAVWATLALFKSNIFGSQRGAVAKSLASMEGGFFVLSASQWLDEQTRDGIFGNLIGKLGLPEDAVSNPISAIDFAQQVFGGALSLKSRYEALSTTEKVQFTLLGQNQNSVYELAAVALSAIGVKMDPRFKMIFTEYSEDNFRQLCLQENAESVLGLHVQVRRSEDGPSWGIAYLGAHHAVAMKSKASTQEVTRCLLGSLSDSNRSFNDDNESDTNDDKALSKKSTDNILNARLIAIGRGKESAKDILSSLGISGTIAQKIVIAAMNRGESPDWIQGFAVMWRGLRQVSRDKLEEDLASFSPEVASKRQKDIETTETNLVSTMLEEMSKSGGMKDALALIASSQQGDRFGQMLAYLQPARRMRILSFVGNADASTIKDSVEMFFGSSNSSALVNEMWMPGQMRREIYLTERIAEANGPKLDGLENFHDFLSMEMSKFAAPAYELNQHSFYDIEEIDGKIYNGTSSGAVKIHFNKTSSELVTVGDKLHICVGNGSYGTRASKGEILLFCFVQASSDSAMDDVQADRIIGMVEIQKGQVIQAKGIRNARLAPDLQSISQDVANRARKKANLQFGNLLEKGA